MITLYTWTTPKDYSIADIATYPWTEAARSFLKEPLGESIEARPKVREWPDRVGERPAVRRGMATLESK